MANLELPGTQTVAERLAHICAVDRCNMCAPFAVTVGGVRHLIASDGYMAVAVASDEPEGDSFEPPVQSCERLLAEAPTPETTGTTAERLVDWSGHAGIVCARCEGTRQVPAVQTCAACDGEGVVECVCCGHDRDCGDCDSTGTLAAKAGAMAPCDDCGGTGRMRSFWAGERTGGLVGGVLVDRRRLAVAMLTVSGDCVLWGSPKGNNDGALHVRGDGWHVILMGIRGGIDETTETFSHD